MRSSEIGNWGEKMIQVLDFCQQSRKDALWTVGSGQYLTLWPTGTFVSGSAENIVQARSPEKGRICYYAPLATHPACPFLYLGPISLRHRGPVIWPPSLELPDIFQPDLFGILKLCLQAIYDRYIDVWLYTKIQALLSH